MGDNEETELEEQFILRLPLSEATKLRDMLRNKPEKVKKTVKINLDIGQATGTVSVGRTKLHAYLRKFPTIIESYKTNIGGDKSNAYKTADISYMLECLEYPQENSKKDLLHGYAPPLKNVKKKRFRKTLVNPEMAEATELVTKELYYLLSTDLEAVSTRFELIHEEGKDGGSCFDNGRFGWEISNFYNQHGGNFFLEKMLFGQVSSTDSDSEIEVV